MSAAEITSLLALGSALLLFLLKEWIRARATNKAIIAEVQRLALVLRRHECWWSERIAAKDTDDHPLIPFSMPVYSSQLKTIGVLDTAIVADVVQFFGYLSFINAFQAARPEYIQKHRTKDFDAMYHDALQRILKSLPAKLASQS